MGETLMPGEASETKFFQNKLAEYKELIDHDIAMYSEQLRQETLSTYGEHSAVSVDAYLDILSRGGKRTRGALTMVGYEMAGGKNQKMIVEAARAVEMTHAYILIIDDINDRSEMRRGGPAAHVLLAKDYRENKELRVGHHSHFGESIAMNAAMVGMYNAQNVMTNLNVGPKAKIKAINALNSGMITTGHGQINDIFNQYRREVSLSEVINVITWKTAHYSFWNPLRIGMTLAGASDAEIDSIKQYALSVGKAYQITDDILGTFGAWEISGKDPMDDTREGKRTVLTAVALEPIEDKISSAAKYLGRMLGKRSLTKKQFEECKSIIMESGALDAARDMAESEVDQALDALDKYADKFPEEHIKFLRGLAHYSIERES